MVWITHLLKVYSFTCTLFTVKRHFMTHIAYFKHFWTKLRRGKVKESIQSSTCSLDHSFTLAVYLGDQRVVVSMILCYLLPSEQVHWQNIGSNCTKIPNLLRTCATLKRFCTKTDCNLFTFHFLERTWFTLNPA